VVIALRGEVSLLSFLRPMSYLIRASGDKMSIFEKFAAGDVGHALATIPPADRVALEPRLTDRGGRLYVRCLKRSRDVRATPEEVIRQLWLLRLTNDFGYPLSRIRVEEPIVIGRDATKKADIVITDADRPDTLYAVIEVKQLKARDGKEQLRSYTNATGAPIAVWSRGIETIVWNRKDPNFFIEIPTLPSATETIASIINEPWTIEDLIKKEDERAIRRDKARTLRDLIVDLEDEVLANAGVDVFEEVFKLIFIKLFDEMECFRGSYLHLQFRNNDTAALVKSRITNLFDKAKKKWPGYSLATRKYVYPRSICKYA
jgi:type I restriction enzyme M protein